MSLSSHGQVLKWDAVASATCCRGPVHGQPAGHRTKTSITARSQVREYGGKLTEGSGQEENGARQWGHLEVHLPQTATARLPQWGLGTIGIIGCATWYYDGNCHRARGLRIEGPSFHNDSRCIWCSCSSRHGHQLAFIGFIAHATGSHVVCMRWLHSLCTHSRAAPWAASKHPGTGHTSLWPRVPKAGRRVCLQVMHIAVRMEDGCVVTQGGGDPPLRRCLRLPAQVSLYIALF